MKLNKLLKVAAMLWPFAALAAPQDAEVLHVFQEATEGYNPSALAEGPDGRLYGTTMFGGAHDSGTVFAVDKQGALTVLHHFGETGGDGGQSDGSLLLAADGNLYGTSKFGGTGDCGTIYRVSPSTGAYAVVRSFAGEGEGCNPSGALAQGKDGRFYGTTEYGGAHGKGTVFRWSPSGKLKTLVDFAGGSDGAWPKLGLTFSSSQRLYGVTDGGGSREGGTVFRLDTDGSDYRVIYAFGDDAIGGAPSGELLRAKDGQLYGPTFFSALPGFGAIYRVSPADDTVSLVFSFDDFRGPLGGNPTGRLAQGADGQLFGATMNRQSSDGAGAAFAVTTAGQASALDTFSSSDPFAYPTHGLIKSGAYLYGTNYPVIYRIRKP